MSRDQGRIGVIVPSSNTNLEPDCALLVPAGITLHFTRVGGYDVDDVPDGDEMRRFALAGLDDALTLLIAADINVIAYGCTSATLASGFEFDQQFQKQMANKTGVPAVTAAGAIIEALKTLHISRIAFTSPYVAELNQDAIRFISTCGFEVVNHFSVGESYSSREMREVTPDTIYKFGLQADHPEAEALVISCTDFRALEALTALERDLGKPVITSNQAMMYAILTRMDIDPSNILAGGQLFTQHATRLQQALR
ncbi:maleate cis-trans isomerase family protein [Microscilla marina]|uniref:Asp/Glu/Hydantoin racemase family protein n=1 Tax=Microscilla marina ATCC 23134 TaxID=313606 RepID=A1ZGW9_MICM2|nr:aspartate/glutamate racemase family protein [Microscilla marina]EAY30238.1 Asp/Glu/Hydantoin racemase family protein [Microscilla marina ATCC 23134]